MIVVLEEAKRKLVALEETVKELGNQLRIQEATERAAELERETMVQDFWNDAEKSSQKLREIKQLKDKVESYNSLVTKLEDTYTLCEMAIEANDEDSVDEVVSETEFIEQEAERKRIEVLLSGPYDKNNAIVSFHPQIYGPGRKIIFKLRSCTLSINFSKSQIPSKQNSPRCGSWIFHGI